MITLISLISALALAALPISIGWRRSVDEAGMARATYLIVALPHAEGRASLVRTARERNPGVTIIVRARYLAERDVLYEAGASHVVFEEGEAGVALARHVLDTRGVEAAKVDKLLGAIRQLWRMRAP